MGFASLTASNLGARGTFGKNLINKSITFRLLSVHEIIALGIPLDGLVGLPRMLGHQLVETLTNNENFARVDINIRRLPLRTAARLMDHGAGVRQHVALARCPTCQQEGTHACRLTDTHRADVGLDELHGVVNRQAGSYRTARRIDIEMNIFIRVFRFEKQHLCNDEIGHVVFNGSYTENHTLFQETRVNIVRTLASCSLLHNNRNYTYVAAGALVSSIELIAGHTPPTLSRHSIIGGRATAQAAVFQC